MSQESELSLAYTDNHLDIVAGPDPALLEEDELTVDAVSQAWADQLDVAGTPSPTLTPPDTISTPSPTAPARPVIHPPPKPVSPAPSSEQSQVVDIIRLQSARLSQLEDVMNRYQMITDQTLARLDCGFQRLECAHTQITRDVNALKTARDAIFDELGFEKMQTRIAASAHPPPPQQFGRGGYRPERQPADPRYEYDSLPWQTQPPRRGRGGGGGRR